MKIIIDKHENNTPINGTAINMKSAANNIDKDITAYPAAKFNPGNAGNTNAYAEHGKTLEDVMLEAGSKDVVARRNYMAVMSNTMSKEDFAKLMKDGTHPGNTEVGTVVTILDHIKAALVKGGTEVRGFTDNVDAEKFEEVVGDKVLAGKLCNQFTEKDLPLTDENINAACKAWDKAREITELSDGAVKYMVENNLPPTIENLYLAKYSGGNNAEKQGHGYFAQDSAYFAKKADSFDWQKLDPQIEKVIHEAGYEINQENLNSGRWLIEKGIPLTSGNFTALKHIQELKLPQDKELIAEAITAAIANGKNPLTANLLDLRSDLVKAVQYAEDLKEVKPEAAEKVVLSEKILNLKNLFAAQKEQEQYINRPSQSMERLEVTNQPPTEKILAARRLLYETSLIMTAEANLRLIRSGINIETAPLEKLVSELKEAEKAIKGDLVGTAFEKNEAVISSRYSLYQETVTKVSEIAVMPADLVGRMTNLTVADKLDNLADTHTGGMALKSAYEKANESYEQLMTAPRRDMGDSIRKAFRNVDAILTESDLELTDFNRRAVRILGYNNMEINHENIDKVKEKDIQMQDIITKMQPGTVLELIREGINPLTMSLDELSDVLNGKNETVADALMNYSQFLARLDRKGTINETERSVYIGVYRLLRQIEKGESAAIGSLLNAEMDFSLGNLLTALRSNRRHGMEYTVDDKFSGVNAVKSADTPEENLAKLQQALEKNDDKNDLRQNLNDIIEKLQLSEENDALISEQLKDIQTIKNVENDIIKALLDSNQPITVNNLIAAAGLIKKPSNLHKKADELAKESDLETILADAKESLTDKFTDEENASLAYDHLREVMTDIFQKTANSEQAGTLDIKELSIMCRQMNLQAAMKNVHIKTADGNTYREERYDIPVEIDGEITAVNLTLRHNKESMGKVSCAVTSAAFGAVTAEFDLNGGNIHGHIAVNNPYGLKKLNDEADTLYANLRKISSVNEIGNIHFIKNDITEMNIYNRTDNNENKIIMEDKDLSMDAEKVSNKELYLIAKAFITFIKREGR
ncbi:MAG: DUF6240 domain-containing protein [Lachnospiraceae bacterium]|nr:DUF6240 domain-containing protein [Lachnospiraceae bacterium]